VNLNDLRKAVRRRTLLVAFTWFCAGTGVTWVAIPRLAPRWPRFFCMPNPIGGPCEPFPWRSRWP